MEILNEGIDSNITLTKEELKEIQLRENILFSKKVELDLLKNERDLYWLSLTKKYALDEKKVYSIDKDGKIIEKENNQ